MPKIPLCETKGIDKEFDLPEGRVLHVLENMDIQIYPNEILAIIGPSGCGKSTFIRILAGLIPATSGKVFYHGKEVEGLLPNFSLVFQNFALYPWLTVKQNIEMVLKVMELTEEVVETKTEDVIALMGLTGFEEAYPREISGGMKQKVGLARALVRNPEILLLDEPFSALDAFTAETLRKELVSIWENKQGALSSIVLISHDIREVVFLADRILMMGTNPGRIRFVKENKLPRPRDYHSKEFLNLVDQLHDAYSQEEPVMLPAPMPSLPSVTPDQVIGFLSYLHRLGGVSDLHKIGAGHIDYFEHLLKSAQASQSLHFVEIAQHTVTLLEDGEKFLKADNKIKPLLWKAQLLTLPLFITVLKQLNDKKRLTHKELIDLIIKEMPRQDHREQYKILIHWGSYGNLFKYHKFLRTLSLT